MHGAIVSVSTLVSVLCLPLPSLHSFDFYEIFLLLVYICIAILLIGRVLHDVTLSVSNVALIMRLV